MGGLIRTGTWRRRLRPPNSPCSNIDFSDRFICTDLQIKKRCAGHRTEYCAENIELVRFCFVSCAVLWLLSFSYFYLNKPMPRFSRDDRCRDAVEVFDASWYFEHFPKY